MPVEFTNLSPVSQVYKIKNGTQLAIDDFVCIDSTTGKVEVGTSGANKYPVGVVTGADVAGGTLLGDSGGTQKAVCASNIEIQYAVTGASATSLGSKVYISTKNALTLTPPVAGFPFGVVSNYVSGTTCKILVFNVACLRSSGVEADILLLDGRISAVEGDMSTAQSDISDLTSLVGNAPKERTIFLGVVGSNALSGTATQQLFTVPATEGYTISKFICVPVNTDAALIAGSQVVNLLIDTTPVTGGTVTVAFNSALGTAIVGTCTAANVVVSGKSLNVSLVASGTGFTADTLGLFAFYAVVQG